MLTAKGSKICETLGGDSDAACLIQGDMLPDLEEPAIGRPLDILLWRKSPPSWRKCDSD